MFTIPFGKPEQQCNKISRRDALTLGGTRLLGGLSLPALLNLEANAATTHHHDPAGAVLAGHAEHRLQPRDGVDVSHQPEMVIEFDVVTTVGDQHPASPDNGGDQRSRWHGHVP